MWEQYADSKTTVVGRRLQFGGAAATLLLPSVSMGQHIVLKTPLWNKDLLEA